MTDISCAAGGRARQRARPFDFINERIEALNTTTVRIPAEESP